MIIHYTIKGVKKGHKKYKEHQAEKERKLAEARGQLPDIQDPSQELDVTCLAEADSTKSPTVTQIDRSDSTNSTASALSALDNDPDFQRYMERQKRLWIESQQQQGLPPSYDASIQQTPISDIGSPLAASTTSPTSPVAELPASTESASKPVEIAGNHTSDAQHPVEADSTPVIFELPGNLPAILPESKSKQATETTN